MGRNVLGEMQLAILLKKHGGKAAAAGWDGDRYAVFEGPKGKLGLVWFSTWDTRRRCPRFHARLCRAVKAIRLTTWVDSPKRVPDSIWRNDGDSLYVVVRHGRDVIVVEGFNPQTTVGLVNAARQAKQNEIKPANPKREATDGKPGRISALVR